MELKGWKFRQVGTDKWYAADPLRSRTEIYADLLDNELIPDPFYGLNERAVQWVADESWEYMAEFEHEYGAPKAQLVFEGLDTYVDVYLNDEFLLHSHNMFHVHKVDVTSRIHAGVNVVLLRFMPALRESRRAEAQHGGVKPHWNGDSSRLYARKAQYHYGWDWGPVLLTCGPWRPVVFETFSKKIDDVYVRADVDEFLNAEVDITVDVTSAHDYGGEVRVELSDPEGTVLFKDAAPLSSSVKFTTSLNKPALWYPRNYGRPNMHKLIAVLHSSDGGVICKFERRAGFRRTELIQQPLKSDQGLSFFFKVNNVPIFMTGSNWIPAHNYLTRLTRQDYEEWVQLAREGNQNMIRVWGGGVYEENALYEACDRAGILVWQDFLFGCGVYPYYSNIAASVNKECRDQLRRMRHFPSIIVYAGNNEDYQIAEEAHLKWDYSDTDFEHCEFPARAYYEKMLPEILKEVVPGAIYRIGCPFGGALSGDLTVGDTHQWNVWHGTQEKYQHWDKLAGRFVSEFGMLALPSKETLASVIPEDELFPQSETMDLHNKADGFERRLALYVMENVRVDSMDIDSWIYLTQLIQSECLAYAYRSWRRNWTGPQGEYVSGALVWQLNDCWPVTSWAICDHFKVPKLSYFAIKRESAPITLGISRVDSQVNKGQKVDWLKEFCHKVAIWAVNMTVEEERDCEVEVLMFDIESGKRLSSEGPFRKLLGPNRSTELFDKIDVDKNTVVQARMLKNGIQVCTAYDWPQPLKHHSFPDRGVSIDISDGAVAVKVKRPVKCLELKCPGVRFCNNGFDICPGESVVVKGDVMATSNVTYRYYCM